MPITADRSWELRTANGGRWGYHLHAHDCWELLLIERGHCKYTIGDFSAGASGPTAFLLAPRVSHSFFTDGFLPNGERIEAQVAFFRTELVDTWRNIPEFDTVAPLLTWARHGVQFYRDICQNLINELRAHPPDPGLRGCARIFDILARLAVATSWQLAHSGPDGEIDSHELERIGIVDEWLHRHFREDISLPQTATALGMSASTLNHLLKKYLRRTFLQHLTSIRIDQARHDLQHGLDSITDIAFACGFNAIPTFNRRFRQVVGKSPQEYRRSFAFR